MQGASASTVHWIVYTNVGVLQEHMPIMSTQLGHPAIVVAKSAQVRTGELLTSP